MKINQIIESRDLCHVCGQTPCNCTHVTESQVNEFAPGGGGGSGDYLRALASAWYNGVFNTGSLPKGIKTQEDVERLLNRGIVCPDGKTRKLHIDYNSDFDGVEIYSDDYYEHGDLDGNDGRTGQPWGPYDHMEFKDEELDEGLAEGYSLGKVLTLPELLDQIKHILDAKHPGIGWRMTMPVENTFLFSAQNDYDVWSMLVVEAGGDDWVAVGHGMVDPDGKPIIFDRQQLPMTLASASEIADEAIQTYHDIDLSDYADDEDYNQGVAEGDLNEKSTSQAQFRTMAAAAHDPEFARKVGIKPSVAREFNRADKGQDYKDLPAKADESKQAPAEKEADYGDDYQDMVKRVKKLAGLGPLKTQYDPNRRVYRNMPTAVQPKK